MRRQRYSRFTTAEEYIDNDKQEAAVREERTTMEPIREDLQAYEDDGSVGASNDTWSANGEGVEPEAKPEIGRQESRRVWRLKLLVLAVLLAAALAISLWTYYYISGSENSQFEEHFADDAKKIFEAIGTSLDKTLGVYDNIAVSLVSHARFANQTWPFVTLPNFALRMAKLLPPSAAITVNVIPIVTPAQRTEWEEYTTRNDYWVNEGMGVQATWSGFFGPVVFNGTIDNSVIHGDFDIIPLNVSRNMLPTWQNFPVLADTPYTYNYDWASTTITANIDACIAKHKATFSKTYMIPKPGDVQAEAETAAWAEAYRQFIPPDEEPIEPVSDFTYPIVDEVDTVKVAGAKDYNPANHAVVGILGGAVYWRGFIRNILPEGSDGIRVVFTNPCNDAYTYQINGPIAKYEGVGDFHDAKYDGLGKHSRLYDLKSFAIRDTGYSGAILDDHCPVTLHLYPSDDMKERYTTRDPIIFSITALLIFIFTSAVFFLYDWSVEHRQETVMDTAVRSTAIVSSLFPAAVRDRLYPAKETASIKSRAFFPESAKAKLQAFLNDGEKAPQAKLDAKPIAELYPDTTVFFADIAGFTAWSSARQPTQVFQLLETLYSNFDEVARRRGVFKVETIGDCYVAVVGLPVPRKNHALVMARFAADCRAKMGTLLLELEKTLGPGTTDLALRFGLHSGPTTAGVLRGDKARFQLFGDTVNTAARMESNGERNRIHISEKTADLMKMAGKGHWLIPREDKIHAKGKGFMTTFWCEPTRGPDSTALSSTASEEAEVQVVESTPDDVHKRLIDWNIDTFEGLLRDIYAQKSGDRRSIRRPTHVSDKLDASAAQCLLFDDVAKCIPLPQPIDEFKGSRKEPRISKGVLEQLRQLITSVADLHRPHAFHNFERCTHVVMATKRLVDGIMNNEINESSDSRSSRNIIASDALTRFAIVFAALVHDVDHPGVSNAQLVAEGSELALKYNGKSVTEQHSINIAWNLLMEARFSDLRHCIYANETELDHFRKIIANAVLATDLWDAEVQSAREMRWGTLFVEAGPSALESNSETWNRRMSIIIEFILQASDLSYAMQHFTVYKKWNECLLAEKHAAFVSGRVKKDPLVEWYSEELLFLDHYVVPLTSKLKASGIFGAASDEFMSYSEENKKEWEAKGHDIVQAAALGLHCDRQEAAI